MTTTLLGLDPGRDKCGVAVIRVDSAPSAHAAVLHHDVVAAEVALGAIAVLVTRFQVSHLVLGDQTTSESWRSKLKERFELPVTLVDERNSSLEARDRYWQMYPSSGLGRWIPQSLRSIPGPIDGIVAILLVERYLQQQSP